MTYKSGDVRRGLGAALVVLTALACLGFAALRDPKPLSLADLEQADSVLMSCEEGAASSSGEPLWCADPSAPHCNPAAPDAPHALAASQPDVALLTFLDAERPYRLVIESWPAPLAERMPPRVAPNRLERPPRA